MSILDTLEPWLKGATGAVVGYTLGLATTHGPRLWRKIKGKDELQVYVEHDPAIIFANAPQNTVGCPMFVPGSPDNLNPGTITDAFAIRQWALEHDGIPASTDSVEVTLTAWDKLDVIVDAVTISCRPISVPNGIVVMAGVGGADIHRTRLDVQLASYGPKAEYVATVDNSTNFSFKLASGDTAKIYLKVAAASWASKEDRAYEWTADLHLLVNNKRKTITVGDNGTPFEYARFDAGPQLLWDGVAWPSNP